MTWVVGLTGGIGSGKSAAADLFAAHGIAVIDTDAIAHELTAPGGAAMPAIRAGFGDGVVAVPLLIESGSYRERVNRVAVVDCREATQVARVMSRNGLPRAEVERILAAQATRAERLAAADDVIDNDGDIAALPPQIDRLHGEYLALARQFG